MGTLDENRAAKSRSGKGFSLEWEIENFNFCWHKTGERLESSSFMINTSCKTFWRLWLYPRGEDDGEYISCYLFRDEGGPNVVDVDFEFKLFVENVVVIPAVSFKKIYSFKNFQTEGLRCFASRREVYAPIAAQKDRFSLTFKCTIFNVDQKPVNPTDLFLRTVIATESISGSEVFDCNSSLGLEFSKDNEIKPLLDDEPLINLNVSYFENYLVLKIIPKSCRKIKCAVCEISIIKHGLNESPLQHVYFWIGEIKTSIWKFCFPLTEPVALDVESSVHNSFLLHYDFVFSTGIYVEEINRTKLSIQECLDASFKKDNFVCTASKALKDIYRSRSFADFKLQTTKEAFPAHKSIVCGRSSVLKTSTASGSTYFGVPTAIEHVAEKFLFFLYSDIMKGISWSDSFYMHRLSHLYKVKLLKKQCADHFKDRLSFHSAVSILNAAGWNDDLYLMKFVTNYIVTHADRIFCTTGWKLFKEKKPMTAKAIMHSVYKGRNYIH